MAWQTGRQILGVNVCRRYENSRFVVDVPLLHLLQETSLAHVNHAVMETAGGPE